jgi:hypothetical protein
MEALSLLSELFPADPAGLSIPLTAFPIALTIARPPLRKPKWFPFSKNGKIYLLF